MTRGLMGLVTRDSHRCPAKDERTPGQIYPGCNIEGDRLPRGEKLNCYLCAARNQKRNTNRSGGH